MTALNNGKKLIKIEHAIPVQRTGKGRPSGSKMNQTFFNKKYNLNSLEIYNKTLDLPTLGRAGIIGNRKNQISH